MSARGGRGSRGQTVQMLKAIISCFKDSQPSYGGEDKTTMVQPNHPRHVSVEESLKELVLEVWFLSIIK